MIIIFDCSRRKHEGLNCIEWTTLILQQMSELSCVANLEKLTTKLLECFEFCQMPKVIIVSNCYIRNNKIVFFCRPRKPFYRLFPPLSTEKTKKRLPVV